MNVVGWILLIHLITYNSTSATLEQQGLSKFQSLLNSGNQANFPLKQTASSHGSGSRQSFHEGKGADTNRPSLRQTSQGTHQAWLIPFFVALFSFTMFRFFTKCLFGLVRKAWIPPNIDEINLQTNVVTQVVNGPVITSLSVVFASLISMTISNLHGRQIAVNQSLIGEVHQLRLLEALFLSSVVDHVTEKDHTLAITLLEKYRAHLFADGFSTRSEQSSSHLYVESTLPAFLEWTFNVQCSAKPKRGQSFDSVLDEVRTIVVGILTERRNRWKSLLAVHFPPVHYAVLALLALCISISFLVATAQAGVLFSTEGQSSCRLLWVVLQTTLSALGVLCWDLSRPFRGAYVIERTSAAQP